MPDDILENLIRVEDPQLFRAQFTAVAYSRGMNEEAIDDTGFVALNAAPVTQPLTGEEWAATPFTDFTFPADLADLAYEVELSDIFTNPAWESGFPEWLVGDDTKIWKKIGQWNGTLLAAFNERAAQHPDYPKFADLNLSSSDRNPDLDRVNDLVAQITADTMTKLRNAGGDFHNGRQTKATVATWLGSEAASLQTHHDSNNIGDRTCRMIWFEEASPENGGWPAGSVIEKRIKGDGWRGKNFQTIVEEHRIF